MIINSQDTSDQSQGMNYVYYYVNSTWILDTSAHFRDTYCITCTTFMSRVYGGKVLHFWAKCDIIVSG